MFLRHHQGTSRFSKTKPITSSVRITPLQANLSKREIADDSLRRLGVDGEGLDEMDRKYLRCIAEAHDGGPLGIETLAAVLGEPRDTLEDVYEPYLLQGGWIQKTPRGRVTTARAAEHLKLPRKKSGGQGKLF